MFGKYAPSIKVRVSCLWIDVGTNQWQTGILSASKSVTYIGHLRLVQVGAPSLFDCVFPVVLA